MKKQQSRVSYPGISIFAVILSFQFLGYSCSEKESFYTASDFEKVPKIDLHFHYDTPDPCYLEFASGINLRLVSPNVNSSRSIDGQLEITKTLKQSYPDRFAFFGTFSVDSFGTPGFTDSITARIRTCMAAGACGIKIWKNIGMVLKDKDGRYVMVDDPAFEPVFRYLEREKIPVLGHLGEPRNCWQPLEEMDDSSNYRYYKSHPEYHMYLHPEAPSYEDQIGAMENLLRKYPGLDYTAAHLASLEWSVDELAKRMEMFPELKVECSARIAHLQAQSIRDYEKVRNFMIRYQDRLLYGTDVGVTPLDSDCMDKSRQLLNRWRDQWIYLATDSTLKLRNLPAEVRGLHLPKTVVDKIYSKNGERFFQPVEY